MSRDDRDQRGGHPHRKGAGLCSGCEYCLPITGQQVRRTKDAAIAEQLTLLEDQEPYWGDVAHELVDGRCLRCGMHEMDIELLNAGCSNDRRAQYRTETPTTEQNEEEARHG